MAKIKIKASMTARQAELALKKIDNEKKRISLVNKAMKAKDSLSKIK